MKKARKTDLPDAVKLHNDWNPNKHEIITDEEKYPKIKVTVGTEPVLDCKPEQSEEGLLSALKQVFKKNKIKYQNKKAVRAWLAEHRPEAYCEKIKTLRIRLEKLLSNYADCIDYHFFQNIAGKIDTAIKAKNGEIGSQQHAITFVCNVDSVMDEIEQIKEEQADLIWGYHFFSKILRL